MNNAIIADTAFLSHAPFNLDARAVSWVEATYRALSLDERVGQLFNFLSRGSDPDELERLERLRPGAITRYFDWTAKPSASA